MDKEQCYQCKKNIHSIHDIYNHATIMQDGKSIIIYICSYYCWKQLFPY